MNADQNQAKPRPRPLSASICVHLRLVFSLLPFAFLAASAPGGQPKAEPRKVVVYCSADAPLARPILDEFEKTSGIKVLAVYDTEATKTTGLVQRLLTEKDHPKADVWWSSEAFGTIRLARAGVLEAYTSKSAEEAMKDSGGWPKSLRGKDGMWYGFGSRARVFVYNTEHVKAEDVPQTLKDLEQEKFKGRIGMARPQFGTTRGQMAMLAVKIGVGGLEGWLTAAKNNGLRLFDGNAAVVRAVATGEIWIGLTDTDDVYSGLEQGWSIAMAFERKDPRLQNRGSLGKDSPVPGPGKGPMLLPNTVARVKGGANAKEAGELIDFLLSVKAQRMLVESESHNLPVDPALAKEFAKYAIPSPAEVDLEKVADAVEGAMGVCDHVLGE